MTDMKTKAPRLNPRAFTLIEHQHSCGRCSIARHPLKPGKAIYNQPVPGAINLGFADGHASFGKLQNTKNTVVACRLHSERQSVGYVAVVISLLDIRFGSGIDLRKIGNIS